MCLAGHPGGKVLRGWDRGDTGQEKHVLHFKLVISAHTILTKQRFSGTLYISFTSSFVYVKKKPH